MKQSGSLIFETGRERRPPRPVIETGPARLSSARRRCGGRAGRLATSSVLLALSLPLATGAQQSAAEAAAPAQEPSPYAEIALGPIQQGEMIDLVVEPPDGEWRIDEEGQEYIISRWPKREGEYKWIDEAAGKVRLGRMMAMTAIDHDADSFYFRIDKPKPIEELAGPTEEEIAAVEDSYRMEVPEVDRLRLVPWDEGLPTGGQWRNGFAIADMNGDGHLDLVHPPARKSFGQPVILLGDGAGHWQHWEEARFADLPYDYGDLSVADLDGDGHLDIVLAMHLTGIVAMRGDGEGAFTAWGEGLPLRADAAERRPGPPSTTNWNGARARRNQPMPDAKVETVEQAGIANFSGRAVRTLDWNGDGLVDILALSEGPTTIDGLVSDQTSALGKVIFLNNGDGSWTFSGGPGAILGDVIEVADLDKDGKMDFVTDSSAFGNAELLNYGNGDTWETASLPDPRTKILAHSVAIADFDRDQRLDVAVAFKAYELDTERFGIDLFYGQPERTFRRESILGLPAGPTRGIDWMTAGDVDGDGDPDLVALPREGGVWILLNDGDGVFVRELSPEADPAPEHYYCAGYRAALRDLDGDDRPELVAVFAGEPGSESLLLGKIPPRCRAFGAIRAWKLTPAPEGGTEIESSAASSSGP